MGFWGTFVLARSVPLLPNVEAVRGFGYQHENLYLLGDGWQLLETRAPLPPSSLRRASARFIAGTATAVLVVTVFNSDCLSAHAQTPDGWSTAFHLPGSALECRYRHAEPDDTRTSDVVAADLAYWAHASGLTPSLGGLQALIEQAECRRTALEGVSTEPFELLAELGLEEADQYPAIVDVEEPVFCAVVGGHGIVRKALNNAAARAAGLQDAASVGPQEPWEAAALRFDAELWAARFRAETDTAALRQRAKQLCADYEATGRRRPPPWRGV